MDYYDVLGISRSATDSEIRKAYKAKSMKHHPDRGGDEEEFKKVNEAYSTLKDPKKKSMYDQFGTTDQQQAGFQQQGFHFDRNMGGFEDIFESFFGQRMDPYGRPRQRQARNKTLNINYTLTLEEAYKGKQLYLEVPLPSGKKQKLDFEIPAGIESGQTVRLSGLGDDSIKNAPPGDIMVTIRVNNDKRFKREGCDLYKTIQISVYELILGCKVEIDHFDKGFVLNIPPGTQPETTFSMQGLGMPIVNAPGIGTLYIKVKGTVPKDLNEQHKDLIERARVLTNTRKDV
jgi:DnaJ-class molecular chaperone